MDNEKNFETEVLTRLAVIESKLDGLPDLKRTVYANENRSIQNEKDINVIKDNNKWAFRTSVGAIITSAVTLTYLIIKIGLGIN